MTHEPDQDLDRDEQRLTQILRSVEIDAPAPDVERLRLLRQSAADAFAQAATSETTAGTASPTAEGAAPISPPATLIQTTPTPLEPTPAPNVQSKRRTSMFTLAVRGLLAISAAVALVAAWLNPLTPPSVSGAVPFSTVLEELRGASTLHLQLEKSGQTSEILVRAPGLVRKQESPQRYQIAAGSRLWKIDEAENTVTESDSPWFVNPDQQIDLLGLLEVGVTDAAPLLIARPHQRTTYNGRDCFAYQVDLPGERGRIQIDAFADAVNNQLVGIIAREVQQQIDARPPLAELRLVALNPPVADDKFVVAKSLTEDGRIGKISDAQGIVVLRPMLARRWTPVCREMLLRPGDWLRTELRGANAVKVTLSSDVELTLGPGTLIECVSPIQARLHVGQVQVKMTPGVKPAAADPPAEKIPAKADTAFTLLAPKEGSRVFQPGGKQLVRVDPDEKLIDVLQTPNWLAGFEGTTNSESLGSLIVNLPDGRNEPLTVGYHKVSVEIRDQIARTTIEESFVNHTPARLEGVFHFPLPQDASISGFGMWIGNELVEADVVEKQRAREIFETILREKRDPGLLEWMGGNIFKARVFPIEGHSEKRIKIVYTQVLPLRANRYRYSYGLRSELLRTKPLRELSLSVTVNSALPLKSVTCPTHSVRALATQHSAQVDFAAQEYIPTRDFEVVCEVDGKQSDVVMIPHRRGSDGYFLVQLTPPVADGNWQRELLPDGKPLKIVLLCDTSSSMDREKRRQQSEFVGTVLTSLGDDDRFQLACADVGTVWMDAEPMSASAENIARARAFLEERISLGWTNLDRAFADVIQKSPSDAQVIYVGDGIVSAGTTDPAAFVQRLRQLVGAANPPAAGNDGAKNAPATAGVRRTFHSVTVGNSHETVVLKGIAAAGGGSTRTIGGEQTPQIVALELLNELTQPGLRELKVEFRGLKVAAVYPGELPNVAAGTQQILVGRYLPEGADQSGEIVVTGLRGTEPVKYAARVNLKDAEDGNSFIPRLWARGHLDHLLAQGQSPQTRDEIIGLSEEFHIMTPYTSLLVLESDADRERFGVKRRYEMRDGEQFFAAGRENANFELMQAQMKRAGSWREGLRRQILASLKGLGRDPRSLQQQLQWMHGDVSYPARFDRGGMISHSAIYPRGGPGGRMGRGTMGGIGGGGGGFADEYGMRFSGIDVEMDFQLEGDKFDAISEVTAGEKLELLNEDVAESISGQGRSDSELWDLDGGAIALNGLSAESSLEELVGKPASRRFDGLMDERKQNSLKQMELSLSAFGELPFRPAAQPFGGRSSGAYFAYDPTPNYTAWVNTLFPALARHPVPSEPPALPESWSAEAIELSQSLLRAESLKTFEGGIELRRVADHFDPRWNRQISRDSDLVLYSSTGWVTRSLNRNVQTIVNYCTPRQRGVYSLAFQLGRQRSAEERDLEPTIVGLHDGSLFPLHEQLRDRIAHVEPAGENRVKLILTTRQTKQSEIYWIDTNRHVVVKHEWLDDGVVTATLTSGDFIEIAGSWWPRKLVRSDNEGLKTSETSFEIKSLARPEFSQRMDAELAAMPSVQFIRLPFVKLSVARQKVADGTAVFDDRLAMILHHSLFQQWEDVLTHADASEKQFVDKPGLRWIRTLLPATMRRNEQARDRLLAEVRNLVAEPRQDELYLTEFILGQAYGLTSWPEFLELVELAKPVYERQPAELNAMLQWMERLVQCHEGIGNVEKSLELRRALAESSPWHVHWQTGYALRLSMDGQFDAAHAWLRKEIDREIKRPDGEDELLRSTVADMYRTQGRWVDLLKFTTEWIERPSRSQSYSSAYAQHLSVLVYNDQLDQANALAQRWMDESHEEGELSEVRRARLESALNFALGNAHNLSIQRMDDRWYQPLGELARVFVDHPRLSNVASRIMLNHYFQQSDVADRLRGELFVLLQADAGTLAPGVLQTLVNWTLSGRMELPVPIGGRKQLVASEIPDETWQKIAATVHDRWKQVQEKYETHTLSEVLHSIYVNRFARGKLLPFLRERVAAAHPDFKSRYLASLFDALLTTEWTEPIEQEAFDRLRDLSDAEVPFERLSVQIPALYRLVDAMIANRQAAAERVLSDQGGLDKLTRQELNTKKIQLQRTGRAELSARLALEAARVEGPLSDWMKIEQTWIDVQLGQNLPEVAQFCWQILGEVPAEMAADDADAVDDVVAIIEPTDRAVDPELRMRALQAILKQRALTTMMNMAVRRTAKPEDVARVLKYIDAGIVLGHVPEPTPDATRPRNDALAGADHRDNSAVWRNMKYWILVALDRPDELERELRQWIRDDVSTAPWRQSLARLLAERGKLDEAIQLLEACDKDKLLSARDYHLLADWYLVVNRRADYERSRIESFKALPEHQLSQDLYRISNRWQQTDNPTTELDENTLFAFKAIFEKSASPESYLWNLRNVFAGSRDFRMLQMLPDAALGRSPQQIYALLQQMNNTILQEVRNEAVADEILARIRTVRAGERTATDHRALDLMEALVERKSSELLNQPGPHIDACLAALQRAFNREWGDGEPQMMSKFLFQLGKLPEKLTEEQLREMAALRKRAPARSRAHLLITNDLCNLIAGSYGRRDEAIREMEIEVRDYVLANDGNWPHTDTGVLDSFVSLYEQAGQYAAGEAVLQRFLARPEHAEQRKWLLNRMLGVYIQALEHNGAVSLGSGRAELFGPLRTLILQQIDQCEDENARYNLVTRAVSMFGVAHRHGIPDAAEEMRKFAFDVMPGILKRQTSQYRNTVTAPVQLIGDLVGPEAALRYVVEQIERYPQRLEMTWENSWQVLGYELARWRKVAGASNLEPRVLALAVRELQRELRTGETRNHHIFHHGYEHFWKEKTDAFAAAAEAVLAEFKTSGRLTMAVAQYLWSGLPRQDRAIEILFIAHRQGILDGGGQVVVVNWLHERQRFAESIPLLETLMASHADNIRFRTQLMTAYFRSNRPRQLTDLIQQTHEDFHEKGRWTEANAAALGRGCVECQQSESAVRYLNEAIALHQRANQGSGLNNATLANYYSNLASANSQLGRTRDAVDAASAAIVCWGPTRRERDDHLRTLEAVLSAATDLDEYVLHLNAQSAMTGQDSPILRKAIGLVYQQRQEHAKAIAQLELAVELQPHDAQTHRALIVSYDASEKTAEATRQLLALIDLHRSDLGLYKELAGRLKDNEAEAERAATSIIEASPGEAENHAAMAELRQTQNRWDEAIPHWEQVAELRKLEPDGLLKLGEAQLHEKRWNAVRGTVEKLRKTQWPSRFHHVQSQASQLEMRIPKE